MQKISYLFVLSLDCGEYYINQTQNLQREIEQHYLGKKPETNNKNPQLVWSEKMTGEDSDLQKQVEHIRAMYKQDPDGMLHRLQARLPLGGSIWG